MVCGIIITAKRNDTKKCAKILCAKSKIKKAHTRPKTFCAFFNENYTEFSQYYDITITLTASVRISLPSKRSYAR